jgi:hypothetical protein
MPMSPLVPWIWAAGGLQLLVASANFFAPRKLRYRENLAKVSPIVREIFIVQNVYVVLVLVAFALVCFLFAPDLVGRSPLGLFLSGFLALFWGGRVVIQLFVYDRELKRNNPRMHALFLAAVVYLTAVFALAALGAGK